MADPIKTQRTALNKTTYNVLQNPDTVIILFDLPFAAGDNPAHEKFELSWVPTPKGSTPSKQGPPKLSKTRETTEPVDSEALTSWTGDVLASGHVAIRFKGLTRGIYKLTRNDGRQEPEVIFDNRLKLGTSPHDELTGQATDRRDQPHQYWTWLDSYVPAKDPDLKRTPQPPDVTKLPVPEPKKTI
jgi:hypothetical protein